MDRNIRLPHLRPAVERVGATDAVPPVLAPLVRLVAAAVLDQLRASAAQPSTDRRIRHDRTALPRPAVLAAIRAGELPAIKVGKFYFIEPGDLDAYYEAHRIAQRPATDDSADEFQQAMARAGLRKGARMTVNETEARASSRKGRGR